MCSHKHCTQCRFGNFRDNFIFANSIKKYISDVKNSRLRQSLPISINDRVILPLREGLNAKFRGNKILVKISEFTVHPKYWDTHIFTKCNFCMLDNYKYFRRFLFFFFFFQINFLARFYILKTFFKEYYQSAKCLNLEGMTFCRARCGSKRFATLSANENRCQWQAKPYFLVVEK